MQQNELILQSKVQEINHLQQALTKQQDTLKHLRKDLESMALSVENKDKLLAQHTENIANLEKEKTLMSRSL